MLQLTVQDVIEKIEYRIKDAEENLSEIEELFIIVRNPNRPRVSAQLKFIGATHYKGAIVKTTKITIEGQPAAVELIAARIGELWPIAYESKDSPVNNPAGDVRRWLRVQAYVRKSNPKFSMEESNE